MVTHLSCHINKMHRSLILGNYLPRNALTTKIKVREWKSKV